MDNRFLAMKKVAGMNNSKKSYLNEDSEIEFNSVDLNKEYMLLTYYSSYSNKNRINSLYNFISNSLENNHWSLLDLESIQATINEHFKFLFLKKKYTRLFILSKNILNYDYEGFHINEHIFETLDEVEKALANSSFL